VRNAHERVGWLEFTKTLKDASVRVRLRIDRCIAELEKEGRTGRLHLISVIGGDSDVGAAWAAVSQNEVFRIEGPGFPPAELGLGERAECFRGSLSIAGRRRAIRHLVAVSAEMAATRLGGATENRRTILSHDDPVFVLYRLSERFGLPVVPDWARRFMSELKRRRAVRPLAGIGCPPVLVTGTKDKFLNWVSRGVGQGLIEFPADNGPVRWPAMPSFFDPNIADHPFVSAEPVE
jgi:hypothetical protein